MRRIAIAALSTTFLASPAPAQDAVQSLINGLPVPNGQGQITGAQVRALFQATHDYFSNVGGDLQGLLPNPTVNGKLSRVANVAALKTLTNYAVPVERDDVQGVKYTHSTTACTLGASGAGDNGAQVIDAAGTGCWNVAPGTSLDQYLYNIDCTGATDSTAKVQAMWTAAAALQMPIDHKACVAQTTSPITVAGHVISKGFRPAVTQATTVNADPQSIGPGAWYYLNHTGKGFVFTSLQGVAGGGNGGGFSYGNDLKGFGTYRNQPTPSTTAGTAYTPCACDFDVSLDSFEAKVDLVMMNPTKGIQLNNAGKSTVDLWGQPLGIGIDALSNYDNAYFGTVHLWTYWSNNPNVLAYTGTNAIGVHTGRADALHEHDLMCFAMLKCLDVDQYTGNGVAGGPNGTAYLVGFDRIYADSTTFGVYVEPAVSGATINVGELDSQPNATYSRADAEGVSIQGSNVKFNISGRLYCDYENRSCADTIGSGGGNILTIQNVLLGSWSRAVAGANVLPAFLGTATSPIMIGSLSLAVDYANGNGATIYGYNSFLTSLWAGNPATAPLIDASNSIVGLASCAGAATCPAGTQLQVPAGRGELIVTDSADTTYCHFILVGGSPVLMGQNTNAANCALTRTNGKLDVTYQNNTYVLTNDLGVSGTPNFYVGFTRMTPFN